MTPGAAEVEANYDRLAPLYEADMGRSMALDDGGWYLAQLQGIGGRVLELGCGSGRITRRLAAAGLHVLGIDRSAGMLAASAPRTWPALRADMAALPFVDGGFDAVLLPYSLATYCPDEDTLARVLGECHRVLRPGGRLLADLFVPRPLPLDGQWRLDYERSTADGTLTRWKRLMPGDLPASRRIERRYRLAEDHGVREWTTGESIRPWTAREFEQACAELGFLIGLRAPDYGIPGADPCFWAWVFRRDSTLTQVPEAART